MASKNQHRSKAPVRFPDPKIADPGVVRVGDAIITEGLPQFRLPDPKIADAGVVRVGDAIITSSLPLNR